MANKAQDTDRIRIEYLPLDEVQRWPRNPKQHDIPTLVSVIQTHGFIAPCIQDERTGKLVAGHGRLEALMKMRSDKLAVPKRISLRKDGMWLLPVVRGVSFATEREAENYLLSDNRVVELGGWDVKELASVFDDRPLEQLLGLGWSEKEITRILAEASPSEAARDETPSDKLDNFNAGVIKQVVLYFKAKEFNNIIDRLAAVMQREDVANHTDAFVCLLQYYEKQALRKNDHAKDRPRKTA